MLLNEGGLKFYFSKKPVKKYGMFLNPNDLTFFLTAAQTPPQKSI